VHPLPTSSFKGLLSMG